MSSDLADDLDLYLRDKEHGLKRFDDVLLGIKVPPVEMLEKQRWIHLVVTDDWSPTLCCFVCPCGTCGTLLTLPVEPSDEPHWTLTTEYADTDEGEAMVTLHPLIHTEPCGSRFFIRRNEVVWA